MAKKKTAEERRRRAAELKEQRLKEERRRRILTITGITAAVVLVVGLLAWLVFMEFRSRVIEGVEEYEVGSYSHVDVGERVDYEQTPPVGGNHWSAWQNCGVYPEAVTPEFAVHSLEHGAVWITYQPDLAEDQVEALVDMYSPGDYLVISPYEGEMDAPIVASSWGRQISAETADDENLQRFVRLYERGTDVPEPGASCSGQISETADEVDAMLQGGGMETEGMEGPEGEAGDEATTEDEASGAPEETAEAEE
ncbi:MULTISPECIES: DUF3105 domain-containing protein [unclassified Nocardiopsis]|uniref:DUF3105 domain-containing protein n=1 Tax=unclassified Nocardiopsis TaxID=2649073 RepID=UPI00135B6310|nr:MULTISPECIES: DUF3105 domain-containing protein [unclassified Nocardiopsis]